ncbi:MAG TPA: hypothetical protein VGH27_29910 [Streptosporangiaceae bacterium]
MRLISPSPRLDAEIAAVLAAAGPRPMVLDSTGLQRLFTICDTVPQAIATAAPPA